ncbi:uncharacterized protein LOC111276751 isoform X1 [Durio zibethinus]|uniref:Uncharacterized protein LOC111276751 isoform X1 n=1 Tax=Durio zibethinus TaxID=66656 RepID=A0A6P5WRE3_DURZI|nr:uncharacterized protein LOC111276751 isoform X1 [Durio zibethinus]
MGSQRGMINRRNCPFNFKTLISSLSSPQGLKPETMEGLYLLLLNLSCSNSESNLNFSETEFNLNEFKVKFKDIHEISNVLFNKLNAKFNELFSALNDVSAHPVRAQSIFHVNVKATIKDLTLLLRCCVAVFKLLVLDQKLVVEKGLILLGILRRCVSVESKRRNRKSCSGLKNKVSHERLYVDGGGTIFLAEHLVTSISFAEPANPFHEILCAVLEVFADELLMHKSVRQYILLADSLYCVNEFLFVHHFGPGNIGSVLEVISAHFILSISDDQAFYNFLYRLFWLPDNNFRVPEVTLTTALSLLLNPIMLSAPKMFQAYLILLVSEVIGISMSSDHMISSSELRSYLLAFERSVALYTRHMSNLHTKGYPLVDDDSFVKSHFRASYGQMDFESCLLPATKEKIHNLISKCDNLWNSYLSNILRKTRSDLVAFSVSYAKESLHVFEESSRDEILSILSCIILRSSSDDVDDTVLHKKEDTSPQDICLLACILKLMSGTMLQAIRILTQGRNSGSLKTFKNVVLSKEYDFLVAISSCFQKFGVRLPVQKFLRDVMEIQPTRHKKSKWMLFHFSGLLSLSYASRLDFLVKNCLFTLMMLLNLFVLEAGNLHALESLLGSGIKSSSHKSHVKLGKSESCHKAREVIVDQKSSHAVALKFQKIQTLYLGMNSRTSFKKRAQEQELGSLGNAHIVNHVDSALSIEENTGETCNGEIFLRCMLEGTENSSDVADLADFVECKQGKDYSDWLRGRRKFRRWKSEKMANIRWQKRRIFQKRA